MIPVGLDKKERKKVFSMNPTFSHLAAPRCTQFANIAPPPWAAPTPAHRSRPPLCQDSSLKSRPPLCFFRGKASWPPLCRFPRRQSILRRDAPSASMPHRHQERLQNTPALAVAVVKRWPPESQQDACLPSPSVHA
jgi:hypothetical protein